MQLKGNYFRLFVGVTVFEFEFEARISLKLVWWHTVWKLEDVDFAIYSKMQMSYRTIYHFWYQALMDIGNKKKNNLNKSQDRNEYVYSYHLLLDIYLMIELHLVKFCALVALICIILKGKISFLSLCDHQTQIILKLFLRFFLNFFSFLRIKI